MPAERPLQRGSIAIASDVADALRAAGALRAAEAARAPDRAPDSIEERSGIRTMPVEPEPEPLLVFDGDCGFCRRRVDGLRASVGTRAAFATSQAVADRFPELERSVFDDSVVLVRPDRSFAFGAEAIWETLALAGGWRRAPLALYRRLPGFRPLTEWGYRQVAQRRIAISKLERTLLGTTPEERSYRVAGRAFRVLLALIYMAALLSLAPQIIGLVGADGILPIASALDGVEAFAANEGLSRWQLLPSFVWWNASDEALRWHCRIGVGLAALLLVGLAPALAAFGLWLTYLSLISAGNVFLGYQWDALLCEVGLLAVFLLPWRLRSRSDDAPPVVARWLAWLLLVRLMVFSGVLKLVAGSPADPNAWHDLSALRHHFATQPLPTPLAPAAAALPDWLLHLACLGVFVAELLLPLLVFCGPSARRLAAAGLALLQVGIALTGNYGFFNVATLALCVLLVDDRAWQRLNPKHWGRGAKPTHVAAGPVADPVAGRARVGALGVGRGILFTAYALLVLGLSGVRWANLAGKVVADRSAPLSAPGNASGLATFGRPLLDQVESLRLVNSYGLFAKMTTVRNEIDVQGSHDGETWLSYRFRYKPNHAASELAWVAPHMPRLDWQMWFLPISGFERSAWFQVLLRRLLEGAPAVGGLFAEDPFPDEPPRYVRARFVHYELNSAAKRRAGEPLWRTRDMGYFVSPLHLTRD